MALFSDSKVKDAHSNNFILSVTMTLSEFVGYNKYGVTAIDMLS